MKKDADVENQEMDEEMEDTGTPDEHYNLVSVLYHALQGAETCAQYLEDADEAGDDELVDFLEEVQSDYRRQADRAKELLAARLGGEAGERKAA
jgi:hypothetical protein